MHGTSIARLSVLLLAFAGASAHAHEHDKAHDLHTATVAQAAQASWGIAGKRDGAQRTIRMSMLDSMHFAPEKIEVKRGETVRFLIRNDGTLLHEFVLGTKATLDEHARMMAQQPNMPHEADYMAHVDPGKTGEGVWTFNRVGQFYYACLVAGHYEAGMIGTVLVK